MNLELDTRESLGQFKQYLEYFTEDINLNLQVIVDMIGIHPKTGEIGAIQHNLDIKEEINSYNTS